MCLLQCVTNKLVMKKFFRTVMAFCLAGGVLAFTGCTDYEDDINKLNERVDALETGKIADVEEQVASLQTALKTAQDAIDAIEALNLEELKQTVADLKTTVDGIDLSKYATLDYVDATFATKDAVADLETKLGTVEGDLNALEGKYDSDVKISEILSKIETAQSDASKALGDLKSLQEALGVYAEAGAIDKALDLKLDVEDFDAKFNEALQKALENGGDITTDIDAAIKSATEALESKIDALTDKVKDLASRIQSLVYVPEYSDGKATGVSYKLFGETVGQTIVKATFQVSPKEYAATLVNQSENVVANIVDVKSRAAGVPEVASVANGKLDIREVEGATDEYGYVEVILYSEKEAGTYAFSLYVASSEDVEAATENPDALADIDAGTYISSEYVQTAFDEKSVVELSGKYSLRDSEKKEIAAEDLNARVEWARLLREESTKVDFFDGYSLYINLDGENYYTIEEAAKIIGAEAEDLTPKYAAGTPVYVIKGNVTAAEIPSYFKIADAEGHAGKTVEMAKTANEMSSVAGTTVSIENTFYFGESVETGKALDFENPITTSYTVINEPVVIRISAPKTEWTYEWAVEHAYKDGEGNRYPNINPIEFSALEYVVEEGDLGSVSPETIFSKVYSTDATLNGTPMESEPLVSFAYDKETDVVDVNVITKYSFSSTEENNYEVTYVYNDELVDYKVVVDYTLGVMPGDITVDLGAANVPVFSTGVKVEAVAEGDAYKVALAQMGENGTAWYAGEDALATFKSALENAVENAKVTVATGEAAATPVTDEDTYLNINAEEGVENAEGSHLSLSSAVINAVGNVFNYTTTYKTWYGVTYTFTAQRTVTAPEYEFAFNPAFVTPEGNVTVNYHTEDGVYVLDEVDPKNYFEVVNIPADFAERLSVKFEVTSPDEKAGTVPTIQDVAVDNATGLFAENIPINWSEFQGRDLEVEAILLLGGNIEIDRAVVNISAKSLVYTFSGESDAAIDRNPNGNTTIDLWDYLSATGLDGSANFLAEAVRDAKLKLYRAEVTFGEAVKATINGQSYDGADRAYTYNAENGTIVVNNDNATLNAITFTVDVELSYYLDNNEPLKTQVTVTISQK